MKKIVQPRSLKLGKEVVRTLGSMALQDVVGGARDSELQCESRPRFRCPYE